MYFLDICNFEKYNQNQENHLCLDFSKYRLIFEKPSTNQDPPKELNGKTLNSLRDNMEVETQQQENFIWSKFYRFDTQVFSKCSLPDNSWQGFSLKRNYLFYFPFAQVHQNLQYLNLSHCKLTSLSNLPSGLLYLNASYNEISQIEGDFPETIEQIKLKYNRLETIPNLPNTIKYLDISHNNIARLPEESIMETRIQKLNYEDNPVFLSREFLDYLDNIGQYYVLPIKFTSHRKENVRIRDTRPIITIQRNDKLRTIYKDSQNVHNPEINDQTIDIYNKISNNRPLSWKKTKKFINKYLIIEDLSEIFYKSGFITKLNASIRFILRQVITFVKKYQEEDRKKFFEMFEIELDEMRVVCLTGILLRLFNCLYVLNENLQLKISNNMQKEARINILKKKYDELMDNEEMQDPYNYSKHYTYLEKIRSIEKSVRINKEYIGKMEENLSEIDVSEKEISEWTSVWKQDAEEFQEILDKMKPITDLFLNNQMILGQRLLNKMKDVEPFLKINNLLYVKFMNLLPEHQCQTQEIYFDEKEIFCSECFTWEQYKRNVNLPYKVDKCCGEVKYAYVKKDKEETFCEKCYTLDNLKPHLIEKINLIKFLEK